MTISQILQIAYGGIITDTTIEIAHTDLVRPQGQVLLQEVLHIQIQNIKQQHQSVQHNTV